MYMGLGELSLLTGNNYFPLNAKHETIDNYFQLSGNRLEAHNFHVIMAEDSNILFSTGNVFCLCLILLIALNLREIEFTLPRVF
jgi:hypothetical protein